MSGAMEVCLWGLAASACNGELLVYLFAALAALERTFPGIWKQAHAIDIAEQSREDMITTIHLMNFRTRRVGYNQLLTTYKRHADVAWEDHLRCATFADYTALARARMASGVYLTDLPV